MLVKGVLGQHAFVQAITIMAIGLFENQGDGLAGLIVLGTPLAAARLAIRRGWHGRDTAGVSGQSASADHPRYGGHTKRLDRRRCALQF